LQACNQNLCNAVSARRQSIINQATTRAAWLSPNGSSRGSSPAYFPGQENEIQADWEINMYFTWVIARGNACQ
jgi:hypothetical protein